MVAPAATAAPAFAIAIFMGTHTSFEVAPWHVTMTYGWCEWSIFLQMDLLEINEVDEFRGVLDGSIKRESRMGLPLNRFQLAVFRPAGGGQVDDHEFTVGLGCLVQVDHCVVWPGAGNYMRPNTIHYVALVGHRTHDVQRYGCTSWILPKVLCAHRFSEPASTRRRLHRIRGIGSDKVPH